MSMVMIYPNFTGRTLMINQWHYFEPELANIHVNPSYYFSSLSLSFFFSPLKQCNRNLDESFQRKLMKSGIFLLISGIASNLSRRHSCESKLFPFFYFVKKKNNVRGSWMKLPKDAHEFWHTFTCWSQWQ